MYRLQCVETHLDNRLTPARKRSHHQASQMPHSQVTVQIDDGRFAPFDAPLDTVSTLPGYRFRLSTEYKILTITHGAIGSPARRTVAASRPLERGYRFMFSKTGGIASNPSAFNLPAAGAASEALPAAGAAFVHSSRITTLRRVFVHFPFPLPQI